MNERLNILFEQKMSTGLSVSEQLEYLMLMSDEANKVQVEELLINHWNNLDVDALEPVFQEGISHKLLTRLLTEQTQLSERKLITYRLWTRMMIAAALLVVSFAGLYLINYRKVRKEVNYSLGQDIFPAQKGAMLILGNGKKISLSDLSSGEAIKESGVLITKTVEGKLVYKINDGLKQSDLTNTISTPNGETYQVNLPDGSIVMLNAASTLTFSLNFTKYRRRLVTLDGEGYFEVIKDKDHPFIVRGRGQEVKVFGTHFNMNSYSDEPIATTTLLEGSVSVSNGKVRKKIKPGEIAISNGVAIQIDTADVEQVMGWTKGDFNLNHVNFKTAMRDIARWYNVEVIYDASVPNDMESGGWIARNKPLSAVLKSIESSGLARFKVRDRKIYVTR